MAFRGLVALLPGFEDLFEVQALFPHVALQLSGSVTEEHLLESGEAVLDRCVEATAAIGGLEDEGPARQQRRDGASYPVLTAPRGIDHD